MNTLNKIEHDNVSRPISTLITEWGWKPIASSKLESHYFDSDSDEWMKEEIEKDRMIDHLIFCEKYNIVPDRQY